MALILSIETATSSCSVALSKDGTLLALHESDEKNIHASALTGFISGAMQHVGIGFEELDAVAVSKGPGSYTGLRIGVSTAKGLCFALDKPLLAVNTLQAMAGGMALEYADPDALYCPMIDARRMEVYCALYRAGGQVLLPAEAKIVTPGSFEAELSGHTVVFFGDGAQKCKEMLGDHPNAVFAGPRSNSAKDMTAFAEEAYSLGRFEDLAYFEPFYLKDFIVTRPKPSEK